VSNDKPSSSSKKSAAPKADFFADLKARSSSLQRIAVGGAEIETNEKLEFISLDAIFPNPHQPRRQETKEKDIELAEDVKQHGILQPIIVRPEPGQPGKYQLVAGSRRCRAAKAAGLTTIPALVKIYDDREARTIAAIENLQRTDLTSTDEAHYFKFLADEYNLSNRDIARLINKSPGYVDLRMRLIEDSETKFKRLSSSKDKDELTDKPWRFSPREWQKFKVTVTQARSKWNDIKPQEKLFLLQMVRALKQELEALEQSMVEQGW
jgi:ParB family chromosome partitioning protein